MTSPWFRPEEPKSAAEPLDGLDAGLRTIVFEKELDREVKRLNKNRKKPRRYTLGDGLFVLITLIVLTCVVASVTGIVEDVVPPSQPATVPNVSVKTRTDDPELVVPKTPYKFVKTIPYGSDKLPETRVSFTMRGRSIFVPVLINNIITIDFILDSGATSVVVPPETYLALVRAGTVSKSDLRGERDFMMADGRMVRSKTFIIRSLRLGDVTIENVEGAIGGPDGLLGQSFLVHFKSWSIDNTQNVIVLRHT